MNTTSQPTTKPLPLWLELTAVVFLLAAFMFTAAALFTRGVPYTDEAIDAEMAINIATGKGGVVFTHPQVEPGKRLVSVAPAYDYSLALWLRLWGVSRLAVMSFNIAIVAAVTLLLWGFVYRTSLMRQSRYRLLLIALLPLLPAFMQTYGTNRYDSIGMLALSLACFTLTIRPARVRRVIITVCGVLVGVGGLHVALASASLALLAAIFTGRRFIPELLCFGGGVALGLTFLFGALYWTDSLAALRSVMEINNVATPAGWVPFLLAPLRGGQPAILKGGNVFLLLALVFACGSLRYYRAHCTWGNAAWFGILAGLAVPLTLTFAGRYSWTYAWLAAAPMLICTLVTLDEGKLPRNANRVVLGLMMIAALTSFPSRALVTALEWTETGYQAPSDFVGKHLLHTDVVYSAYQAYYPVKARAADAYFGMAIESMTPSQRAGITAAVLTDEAPQGSRGLPNEQLLMNNFGGAWHLVASLTVPRGRLRMQLPPQPMNPYWYSLRIYRKDSELIN